MGFKGSVEGSSGRGRQEVVVVVLSVVVLKVAVVVGDRR